MYAAALEGLDIIVFTGGIGENAWRIRENICKGLEFLGVNFNTSANTECYSELREISNIDSKVKVLIVPTNEELVIARDTKELIEKSN